MWQLDNLLKVFHHKKAPTCKGIDKKVASLVGCTRPSMWPHALIVGDISTLIASSAFSEGFGCASLVYLLFCDRGNWQMDMSTKQQPSTSTCFKNAWPCSSSEDPTDLETVAIAPNHGGIQLS